MAQRLSSPGGDLDSGGVPFHPDGRPDLAPGRRGSPKALAQLLRGAATTALWTVWVNMLASSALVPRRLRRWMLQRAGMHVETIGVSAGCSFTPGPVWIGRDVYINQGLFVDARGGIRIGDRVAIGPRVMLVSSTHAFGPARQRCADHRTSPVTICDGAAIGAGVAIHAGVTVGAGAVIAGGAVVIRDCAPNTVYAGVPAAPVRQLADD